MYVRVLVGYLGGEKCCYVVSFNIVGHLVKVLESRQLYAVSFRYTIYTI